MLWKFFQLDQNSTEWPGSHLFHFHEESLSAPISVIFLLYFPQNCGNQEEGQETSGESDEKLSQI